MKWPAARAAIDAGDAAALRNLIAEATSSGTLEQQELDSALRVVCWSRAAADAGVQLDMIDALVDAGAAPAKNANNALVAGHLAAAEHLLSRGATLTLGAALCSSRWEEAERLNAAATPAIRQFSLVLASLNGKPEGVEWILARGAPPDEPSPDLYPHGTPLHHAVSSGSLETVKVLVRAGANMHRRDSKWNGTPLGWAEYYQHDHIAAYLRDRPNV